MWLQIHLTIEKHSNDYTLLKDIKFFHSYNCLYHDITKLCISYKDFFLILHRNNLYKILEFHVKSSSSSHEGNSRNGRKMTTVHLFITYSPLNSFYIFNTIVRYSCSLYVLVCSYKRLKNGLSFVTFLTWQ